MMARMNMTPRSRLACLFSVVVISLVALEGRADEDEKDPTDWKAEVPRIWERNCRNCHTAPDPGFETDRGFLAQIMETT